MRVYLRGAWQWITSESCLTCYAANDGRLLSILPADVAVAYPVLPRYAPPIPPAKDLSDDWAANENPQTFIAANYTRKLGVEYTRKVETSPCRSQPADHVVMRHSLLVTPPAVLFALLGCRKQHTHLMDSRISIATREMQSVTVSETEKLLLIDVSNHKKLQLT
jgi:hypothetical protein